MMAYAVDTYNFFALPFLAIFVSGYYWAGCASLWAGPAGPSALAQTTPARA